MENVEFKKYNNKAMSVRMQDDTLLFFLKYAQQTGAGSISETFKKMLDELQQYHDLDTIELQESIWTDKGGDSLSFLKAATNRPEKPKDLLVLNAVKLSDLPEPEPEELELEDDDEDVFTI